MLMVQIFFSGCSSLTSVKLPEGLTDISASTFEGCSSLESVVIPQSVTKIDANAFAGCVSLASIELPAKLTAIGMSAFAGCNHLSELRIPETVTSIGCGAFAESGLSEFTVPESINSIHPYVMAGGSRLADVKIPATVTTIGKGTFFGCNSIGDVTVLNPTPPVIADNTFTDYSATLTVPVGSVMTYSTTDYWREFTNITDENSAISNVSVNEEANDMVTVYNLQGMRMKVDTRAEMTSLRPGLYIVNGRKELVK